MEDRTEELHALIAGQEPHDGPDVINYRAAMTAMANVMGMLHMVKNPFKGTPWNVTAARGRHIRPTAWYAHPALLALRASVTGSSRPHRRWLDRELAKGTARWHGTTMRYEH